MPVAVMMSKPIPDAVDVMSMDVWNGIAYCGLGFGARTLFVTDFATGTILFSYETNSIYGVHASRIETKALFACKSGHVFLVRRTKALDWELETLVALPLSVSHAVWDVAEAHIAVACDDSHLHIYDTKTNTNIARFGPFAYFVQRLAFSPDGRLIVASDSLGNVALAGLERSSWSLFGNIHTIPNGTYKTCPGVAVSPDGRYVVCRTADGLLRVWEIPSLGLTKESLADVKQVAEFPAYSLTFCDADRLIIPDDDVSGKGQVHILSIGEMRFEHFDVPHRPLSVAYDATTEMIYIGTRFGSIMSFRHSVRAIWDLIVSYSVI